MTLLMMILLVGAVVSVFSVRTAMRDGLGWRRPPTSSYHDPRFREPSNW